MSENVNIDAGKAIFFMQMQYFNAKKTDKDTDENHKFFSSRSMYR